MNCMKLLGQNLAARDFERQTAELHIRIAILDRFTHSAFPSRSPSADIDREKGSSDPQTLRATAPLGSGATPSYNID